MFEEAKFLLSDLKSMLHLPRSDEALYTNIINFVSRVSQEVDLAFSDVYSVLGDVVAVDPSTISKRDINELSRRVEDTYARETFKNLHKICERLDKLANEYQKNIAPKLAPFLNDPKQFDQIYYIITKKEGSIIYMIKRAIDTIPDLLRRNSPKDIEKAQAIAADARKDLSSLLDEFRPLEVRMHATARDSASMLLNPEASLFKKPSKQEINAVFLFGVVFIIAIMVLAFAFPNPTPIEYLVMRIVLAVATAGIATLLTGFIDVTIPHFVKAGGAFAVFVIVFFYNPAALVVASSPPDIGLQRGPANPGAAAPATAAKPDPPASIKERCNLAGTYGQQRERGPGEVSGSVSITCSDGDCTAHSKGGNAHLRPIAGADNAYFAEGWNMSVTVSKDCRRIELERTDVKDVWTR
jgi:hypothetical protein